MVSSEGPAGGLVAGGNHSLNEGIHRRAEINASSRQVEGFG